MLSVDPDELADEAAFGMEKQRGRKYE